MRGKVTGCRGEGVSGCFGPDRPDGGAACGFGVFAGPHGFGEAREGGDAELGGDRFDAEEGDLADAGERVLREAGVQELNGLGELERGRAGDLAEGHGRLQEVAQNLGHGIRCDGRSGIGLEVGEGLHTRKDTINQSFVNTKVWVMISILETMG